jgi:hypothetical protein
MPQELRRAKIHDYQFEQNDSHGEIFRQIILNKNNKDKKEYWLSRLENSSSIQNDIRQLLGHRLFKNVFDRVANIRGLFHSIELGTLHRFHNIRCDEVSCILHFTSVHIKAQIEKEIYRALRKVSVFWKDFIVVSLGIEEDHIDEYTVMMLEGLAPGVSRDDSEKVTSLMAMSSSMIFPALKDKNKRKRLLEKLLKVEYMIPTIHLVFEMLKHLEPACEVLKKLADTGSKWSIRHCLWDKYDKPQQPLIEMGKEVYFPGSWSNDKDTFEFLYAQLWAITLRCFWDVSSFTPKKEKGRSTPKKKQPNPALFQRIGNLAICSGFHTDTALLWKGLDRADSLVSTLKERAKVGMNKILDDRTTSEIAKALRNAPNGNATDCASPVSFFSNQPIEQDRRLGRPFEDNYDDGEKEFFLQLLLQSLGVNEPHDPFMSFSFVRRQLFFLFFDQPPDDEKYFSQFSTLKPGILGEFSAVFTESIEPNEETLQISRKELETLKNLKDRYESFRFQYSNLREAHEKLTQDYSSKQIADTQEIKTLKAQQQLKDKVISEQNLKLNSMEMETSKLTSWIQNLQKTIEESHASNFSKDNEITKLRRGLEKTTLDQTSMIKNLQKTIEESQAMISGKDGEISKLRKLENTVLDQTSTIQNLQKMIKESQAMISGKDNGIAKLENTILHQTSTIQNLQKKSEESQAVISSRDGEIVKLGDRVDDKAKTIQNLQKTIEEFHESISNHKANLSEREAQLLNLESELKIQEGNYQTELQYMSEGMQNYDRTSEQLVQGLLRALSEADNQKLQKELDKRTDLASIFPIYFHFIETRSNNTYTFHCDRDKCSAVFTAISQAKTEKPNLEVFVNCRSNRLAQYDLEYLTKLGGHARCFWIQTHGYASAGGKRFRDDDAVSIPKRLAVEVEVRQREGFIADHLVVQTREEMEEEVEKEV